MGDRQTGWWDGSWNPYGGCGHASPGCRECYAEKDAGGLHTALEVPLYAGVTDLVRGRPRYNGTLTVWPPDHPGWCWPSTWPGAKFPNLGPGQPSLIFVGDMADLFHEDRPWSVIDEVVGAFSPSPHIGLLLTKRADVMAAYFQQPRVDRMASLRRRLWLGFSAERQREFDERWPHMRKLAQAGWLVYVVCGPMLGPVTLPEDFLAYGDRVWVIASGEQPVAKDVEPRPMNPDWARALRGQCAASGTAFFMNQMAGRKAIPADLFVRQFPSAGMS